MILSKLIRNSTVFRIYASIRHLREGSRKRLGEDDMSIAKDNEKKALFVLHELSLTGAPIVMYNFANLLKNKGWEVVIASPKDGPLKEYARERGVTVLVVPDILESEYICEVRGQYSKIIVGTVICGPVVKKLNNTASDVIWWIHEAELVYVQIDRKLAEIMPWTLSDNVHVYCAGGYAQKMLAKRFPKYKTDLLIYYADDLRGNSNLPRGQIKKNDKKRYTLVGSIEERKGQDILLRAIDLLPEAVRKDSLFTFVGVPFNEDMRKKIVEKKEAYPGVIQLYEGLPREELYEIYRETDFLICSSRDDPMPVVIAEAMSLGIPCICSQNTGSAEIIERNKAGWTYGNNDPRILARRIEESFNITDNKYEELSNKARYTYDKNFSMEVFEKNVMKIMSGKVLVTGAEGQLGHDVVKELESRGYEVIGSDIGSSRYINMDITDREQTMGIISELMPEAIIHCAAWTDVDGAEADENRDAVHRINVTGTENIALAAKSVGAKMLYISTDYVYDGQGTEPRKPEDKNYKPLNYYGRTKLEGEKKVEEILDKYYVVRTAWVFGCNGNNFVKTMAKVGRKNNEVRVVNDQIGTPTYTADLACLLADMIETDKYGYYHATNEGGYISWYEFTCEIYRLLGLNTKITPVTTEEYGLSVADRPLNSRLDKSKLADAGFERLPDWKDALKRYIMEAEL